MYVARDPPREVRFAAPVSHAYGMTRDTLNNKPPRVRTTHDGSFVCRCGQAEIHVRGGTLPARRPWSTPCDFAADRA